MLVFSLVSCGGDDDICLAGEATPRMKVKFKSTDGKLKTLDSLYVEVEYQTGMKTPLISAGKVDSVMIPLRVDDNTYTKVYFHTVKAGNSSMVQVNYTTGSKYVSPACGLKRLYNNLNVVLQNPNPVLGIETNQSQITDENKTHLYLIF